MTYQNMKLSFSHKMRVRLGVLLTENNGKYRIADGCFTGLVARGVINGKPDWLTKNRHYTICWVFTT
jgi:hypothetical protein